jgi:EmrB/QacA subfamily drug resistance transporter
MVKGAVAAAIPGRSHRETLGLLSGAFLAMTLAALDQAIVMPALPAIAHDLRGLDRLSWVVVAYLITSTTMTLVYGKISDMYGRGKILLIAIVLFVGASVLCGLAQSMTQLVVARGLQGMGAGGLLVMAQAMIGDLVAPRERGRYQAYVSAVFAISSISGPPLGGFLVGFDWRWCFWINLPLGALALVLCARVASRLPKGHQRRNIDYLGLTLLTGSVTAFLLVCSWGGTSYSWLSLPIAATFVVSLLLLSAFVWRERRTPEPLFPPRLFAKNNVRLADAVGFFMSMLVFASLVLLPSFLQLVMQIDPGRSGVLLVALLAGTTLGSLASGQIMHATGRGAQILPFSLALTAVGFLLLSTMHATIAPALTVMYMFAVGAGLGACYPVLNATVQNAAGPGDIGVATSSIMFARSLGGAVGAAVFWSLLLGFLTLPGGSGKEQLLSLPFIGAHAPLGALPPGGAAALVSGLERAFHNVFLICAGVALFAVLLSTQIRGVPLKTERV